MKHARRDAYNFINEFSFQEVLGNAEKSYNTMQLSPGNKVAFAIIGINTLVCLLWRIPRLQPAMYRYFTNSFASSKFNFHQSHFESNFRKSMRSNASERLFAQQLDSFGSQHVRLV